MSDPRWVVLGLGPARAEWFRQIARWATAATVPIDFVKCVSANEVRVRVSGGRPYSALLVGDSIGGADRDLIAEVRSAGTAVIVVDPTADRDWDDLGVAAVLHTPLDRAGLVTTLRAHAPSVSDEAAPAEPSANAAAPGWRGCLIAVTGAGGVGTSTVAMALAREFGAQPSHRGMVALADLALHADLAMLHDARDIVPGVSELVEAHRHGRVPVDEIRAMTFEAAEHGYHLLLGLRRHRDWTALRPRAFAAALEGLRRAFRVVVADVDADVEGETATGSIDVEERNSMARTSLSLAEIVVVVGAGDVKGTHAFARTIRDLTEWGVPSDRLVACVNRAPRRARGRAEIARALAQLVQAAAPQAPLANPVFLGERPDLDGAVRNGRPLPGGLGRPLRSEIERRLVDLPAPEPEQVEPQPVVPGSLGSWADTTAGGIR